MSYILDALKKSEQERELGQIPSFSSQHYEPEAGRQSGWLWLLVTTVMVVGAAAAGMWLSKSREYLPPAHPVVQPADRPQAMLPASPPLPPQEAPAQPSSAPVIPEPAAGSLRELAFGNTPGRKAAVVTSSSTPATVDGSVSELAPAAEHAAAALPDSAANLHLSPPAEIPVPTFDELGLEVRQQIPPLSVDVHVYSPRTAERFVFLNMKKYTEGERLGDLVVERITEDGVLMRFGDTSFLMLRQ